MGSRERRRGRAHWFRISEGEHAPYQDAAKNSSLCVRGASRLATRPDAGARTAPRPRRVHALLRKRQQVLGQDTPRDRAICRPRRGRPRARRTDPCPARWTRDNPSVRRDVHVCAKERSSAPGGSRLVIRRWKLLVRQSSSEDGLQESVSAASGTARRSRSPSGRPRRGSTCCRRGRWRFRPTVRALCRR